MSEASRSSSRGRSNGTSASTPLSSVPSTRSSSSSRPKLYSCDYEGCDKMYSRPSLLTQHQRIHSDSRPFVCEVCDRGFFRDSHLKTHLVSHSEEKPFKCSTCGKGVNTKQHLKRHEITHTKSFVCEYELCEESFYKHQQLRHHVQSVHLKTLSCNECGKTFPRPYRLANHKAKHHGESPAYQCDFTGCFNSFKTWSALQLHMKTDHPKIKCPVCEKGCVGEDGLRMHMIVHDDNKSIKNWKCTECPSDFVKKDELIVHCLNDHNFIPSGLKGIAEEKIQKDPKILSTEKVEALISNGESAVDILFNTIAAPLKQISCSYKNCIRVFKNDYDLKRHLMWHDKQKQIYANTVGSRNDNGELGIASVLSDETTQ